MRVIVSIFSLLFFCFSAHALVTLEEHNNALKLTTLYGSTVITEPVIIALIQSPPFKRLQHIHQYGVARYAQDDREYTRYQHSLGVFFLTRHFGAPLEEQIAALLHDVSHTVFSHVGDQFFKSDYRTPGKDSYQDGIHEWYLQQVGITAILEQHGYKDACSSCNKKAQRCFDQKLPGLCADRIEYNITGAYLDGLITQREAQELIANLHFVDGEWFFEDIASARIFGMLSLHLTEHRWGGAWSAFIDQSAAAALRRAHELGLLTVADIHFSTDDVAWQILCNSHDPEIQRHLAHITECRRYMTLCMKDRATLHVHGKFSGTDPQVLVAGKLYPLSLLDSTYKKEYERVKQLVMEGFDVAVHDAVKESYAIQS